MNEFYRALTFVNENFYAPNHLMIEDICEEAQNSEYGAGTFQLNTKSVRFRVAKTTPTKIGQFVAFWEKDEANKNQAYSYEQAPDLLIINTFTTNRFGQFIFPKDALLKQKILKTATTNGKMAIRVYPSWDKPVSKQAIKTQSWQLEYFIELSQDIPNHEFMRLFGH
ncbi:MULTISPECIES: MepB family protein [Niallia]|uniref:Mep operon protein MepB n=1 Tax=Niallia circulans TaxID=1397 RepID=A0A553STZ5_NIACI|nr:MULTISPECIES: MepB family protein [Niallia]MED3965129.1 MepB family protein [Niallia taxi]TRZ40465.1 mep operon protein MepB [Niallia circulans]